jgi:hypothetical protein
MPRLVPSEDYFDSPMLSYPLVQQRRNSREVGDVKPTFVGRFTANLFVHLGFHLKDSA